MALVFSGLILLTRFFVKYVIPKADVRIPLLAWKDLKNAHQAVFNEPELDRITVYWVDEKEKSRDNSIRPRPIDFNKTLSEEELKLDEFKFVPLGDEINADLAQVVTAATLYFVPSIKLPLTQGSEPQIRFSHYAVT